MFRDQYLLLIKGAIIPHAHTDDETLNKFARRIERSCYNKTIEECTKHFIPRIDTEPRFTNRYSAECYRIISCINSDIVSRMLVGSLESSDLGMLSCIELRPDVTQDLRDEIELRSRQQVSEKYAKEKCRRCNANRVIKIEVHTRAADELSVWQYKCRECSHTWSV